MWPMPRQVREESSADQRPARCPAAAALQLQPELSANRQNIVERIEIRSTFANALERIEIRSTMQRATRNPVSSRNRVSAFFTFLLPFAFPCLYNASVREDRVKHFPC